MKCILFIQVLRFNGYFKQTVHESANEYFRVRPVDLFYYLEDDSIAVIEPHVENSGMPQGKFCINLLQHNYTLCICIYLTIDQFNPYTIEKRKKITNSLLSFPMISLQVTSFP